MDYCKPLKREDFEFDDGYLAERFKRGLAAGFTFQQCCFHHLVDLVLALNLIIETVGHRLHFPDKCSQTQTST